MDGAAVRARRLHSFEPGRSFSVRVGMLRRESSEVPGSVQEWARGHRVTRPVPDTYTTPGVRRSSSHERTRPFPGWHRSRNLGGRSCVHDSPHSSSQSSSPPGCEDLPAPPEPSPDDAEPVFAEAGSGPFQFDPITPLTGVAACLDPAVPTDTPLQRPAGTFASPKTIGRATSGSPGGSGMPRAKSSRSPGSSIATPKRPGSTCPETDKRSG